MERGRKHPVGFNFGICNSCQRLMDLRKKRLEDAINHIVFECRLRLGSSRAGGLLSYYYLENEKEV